MSAPSTFSYDTGVGSTPSEIVERCHFKDKSFDLFKTPAGGNKQPENSENLLKLLIIIAYDTNKLLNLRLKGGSLKKNKKNKRSQKK